MSGFIMTMKKAMLYLPVKGSKFSHQKGHTENENFYRRMAVIIKVRNVSVQVTKQTRILQPEKDKAG